MKRTIVLTLSLLGLAVLGRHARAVVAEEKSPAVVNLDIKEAGGEDALATLLKINHAKHALDASAQTELKDTKVTASFKGVEFERAVTMLSNALGLTHDKKENTFHFRAADPGSKRVVVTADSNRAGKSGGTARITVTKGSGDSRSFSFSLEGDRTLLNLPALPHLKDRLEQHLPRVQIEPRIYSRLNMLGGKSVTCPHCQKKATIQAPMVLAPQTCSKCNRNLQREFKFCPWDGNKLPGAESAEPRFCPYCGKTLGEAAKKSDEAAESAQSSATKPRIIVIGA